jgi:hypothetical protein
VEKEGRRLLRTRKKRAINFLRMGWVIAEVIATAMTTGVVAAMRAVGVSFAFFFSQFSMLEQNSPNLTLELGQDRRMFVPRRRTTGHASKTVFPMLILSLCVRRAVRTGLKTPTKTLLSASDG